VIDWELIECELIECELIECVMMGPSDLAIGISESMRGGFLLNRKMPPNQPLLYSESIDRTARTGIYRKTSPSRIIPPPTQVHHGAGS